MTVSNNLLNVVSVQKNNNLKNITPVASVCIADVSEDSLFKEEEPLFSNKALNVLAEKIKQKLFDLRIKKLENIPPEKRTKIQEAEIEANQRQIGYNTDLDCMI